ncbi:MAG: acetyl-CoA synthetase, partial [Thermoleophilaceae bacterium]|nr:acetyl-CoA synthetase [Thermoleophilaceae bacterium]
MADTDTKVTGEDLEKEIEKLLDQETFEPPEEFKENALWNDSSIYEEADKDIPGWWAKHAKELHWFEEWDEVLDDSNP